jgi:hypothetical protein
MCVVQIINCEYLHNLIPSNINGVIKQGSKLWKGKHNKILNIILYVNGLTQKLAVQVRRLK